MKGKDRHHHGGSSDGGGGSSAMMLKRKMSGNFNHEIETASSKWDQTTAHERDSNTGRDSSERDEIKEVQLMAKADTNRIRVWRCVVTLVILCVGVAVTLSTHHLLRKDEDDSMEAAVRVPVLLFVAMRMALTV